MTGQDVAAEMLAEYAVAAGQLGSALYAELLAGSAQDVRAGGPVWGVLAPHADRDRGSALPLRLMAAGHRMVLTGRAPGLAAHYPSAGGTAGVDGAWPAFRALAAARRDALSALVALPCQTNEVNRCAALLPGFLFVARQTGLPLRVLEVGASAGLNLRWDSYRYEGPITTWGDASSPVRLGGDWDVPEWLGSAAVDVVYRGGCDVRPLDPTTEEGRLRLSSAVWADQVFRFERLRAALAVAGREPVAVEQARVADWLPEQLREPAAATVTVVYHSVVYQYLSAGDRAALHRVVTEAGARATPEAPLAWLHMEPAHAHRAMRVQLTLWRGGAPQHWLVATAGAHGDPVRWRGERLDELLPLMHGDAFRV